MVDYKALYTILFNGITDALGDFAREDYNSGRFTLMRAQQAAEALYISGGEDGKNQKKCL